MSRYDEKLLEAIQGIAIALRSIDETLKKSVEEDRVEYLADPVRLMRDEVVEDDYCSTCVRSGETITSSTICCFCTKGEDGKPPTNYEPRMEGGE